MEPSYLIAGKSDIGYQRESQEDFILYEQLDPDNLFVIIADGTGSSKDHIKPGVQVAVEIRDTIKRVYAKLKKKDGKNGFLAMPNFFMEEAFLYANRLLGAFKIGDEETYRGYGASVTACLFREDGRWFCCHTGNTRMYLLRDNKIQQVTHDQTKGAELVADGKIDLETYYTSPYRLEITGGLGIVADPIIEKQKGTFRDRDIALFTTDGVHYAVRGEYIEEFVLGAGDVANACDNLIEATKEVKYPDNAACIVVTWNQAIFED